MLHRVPFFETDAMGIVHHSNYVRYLELARTAWLDEHHRSYREVMETGRHFATTRLEVDYLGPLRFDESVEVTVSLEWVRGASLRMAYSLRNGETRVAVAATEHALVDGEGHVRRIPRSDREALRPLATG